jgi:hypothetical protein
MSFEKAITTTLASEDTTRPARTLTESKTEANRLELTWSIKSLAGSPKGLMIFALSCALFIAAYTSLIAYIISDTFSTDPEFVLSIIAAGIGSCWYFIIASRQKKIYRYRIFTGRGKLVHADCRSKHFKTAYKSVTFVAMLLLLLVGLMSNFLLFIIGPGLLYLILAVKVMTWKHTINRDTSLPWHEYNFVTIDRKYRTIVTHKTDPTLGFEARLPNDELFEQYLAFLRTVLPAHVEYTEKRWDWSLI